MDAREAYEVIRGALSADRRKRIVDSAFDEVNFGNFHISYRDGGEPKSIMNDRGELVLCGDLEGSRDCTTVLPSLHGANEQTVLAALKL